MFSLFREQQEEGDSDSSDGNDGHRAETETASQSQSQSNNNNNTETSTPVKAVASASIRKNNASPSSSGTVTATTPTPTPCPSYMNVPSFEEAHRETCLRRHSLCASFAHTLSCAQSMSLSMSSPSKLHVPRRKRVLVWNHDADEDARVFLARNSESLGWKQKQSSDSYSYSRTGGRILFSVASSIVSWTVHRLSASFQNSNIDDDDDDDEISHNKHYNESAIECLDTASVEKDQDEDARVRITDLVLCETLVVECLQYLMRLVQTSPVSDRNPSRVWMLQSATGSTGSLLVDDPVLGYRQWLLTSSSSSNDVSLSPPPACNVGHIREFLSALPDSETLWLCRLLEYGGVLKVVTRPDKQSTVLVLLGDSTPPTPGTTSTGTAASVETQQQHASHALAVFDLLQARCRLERLADSSHNQAISLRQTALEHKRHNQIKSAMTVLQRAKLYQQQADQAQQVLLTVEQSLSVLDSSTRNHQVVQALQQANEALALQNQRLDVEKVDQIMDDLAEQVALHQKVHDALTNSSSVVAAAARGNLNNDGDDDDALLQELHNLTIHETSSSSDHATATTSKSSSSSSKEVVDTTTEPNNNAVMAELVFPAVPVTPVAGKAKKDTAVTPAPVMLLS